MAFRVIEEDIAALAQDLRSSLLPLEGSTWVISGGAGFLGAYFLDLLNYCNQNLYRKPCKVLCLENFSSGTPQRVRHLIDNRAIKIVQTDIVKPFKVRGQVDFIIHAASIASPSFYRERPIQTIETNVLGLRNLLELARDKRAQSVLFLSSSEIYGDPPDSCIPTAEDYKGNVSCTGPRACYDESKRLGETLAVNYCRQYGVPVKIVRPFNIYGPGLRLDDRRVLPDFFRDAMEQREIGVFSDGTPTRSFCYVQDAIRGFMAVLFSEHNGEAFNIGNDSQEISMLDLARLVAETAGGASVKFQSSADVQYLMDNPRRRCPDLGKARALLNYQPRVGLEEGLARLYSWYQEVSNSAEEGGQ